MLTMMGHIYPAYASSVMKPFQCLTDEENLGFVECFTFHQTLGQVKHLLEPTINIGTYEVIDVDPRQYAVPYPEPMASNEAVVTLRDFILKMSNQTIASTMAVITSTIDTTIPHSNSWGEFRVRPFLSSEAIHRCLDEIPTAIMRNWKHERHLGQGIDAWLFACLNQWLKDDYIDPRMVLEIKQSYDAMTKQDFLRYIEEENPHLQRHLAAKALPTEIWQPDVNQVYLDMLRYFSG